MGTRIKTIIINDAILNELPMTKAAVMAGAYYHRDACVQKAIRRRVSGGGDYYMGFYGPDSIKITDGGFDYVVTNSSRAAEMIEFGRRGFHLPTKIDWSQVKNVKKTSGFDKKGNPVRVRQYFIVPFSWFEPRDETPTLLPGFSTSMPAHQFRQQIPRSLMPFVNILKGRETLTDKVIKEFYKRETFRSKESSFKTVSIRRARKINLGDGATGINPAWSRSQYAGIRKADYHRRGNRWIGSGLISFRMLADDSKGWHIPAVSGKYIMRDASKIARKKVHAMIAKAVKEDIRSAIIVE